MVRWNMGVKLSSAIMTLAFLALPPGLCAQRKGEPSLGEILERLQANLDRYDASLPSLFCNERVVSLLIEPGERDQKTITESLFRLKRTIRDDQTTSLIESREVESVNGRPATSQKIDGPTLLNGIFEGGLDVVSIGQTSCMNYRLERHSRRGAAQSYVVRFATALTPENSADCLLQEKSNGRVSIDPASMQVTHLEIVTPRHTIMDESDYTSRVIGRRELSVDYAPVMFGGETFWLPTTISMRNTSGSGFHQTVWLYQAVYRNYHRLKVTSRILSNSEAGAP